MVQARAQNRGGTPVVLRRAEDHDGVGFLILLQGSAVYDLDCGNGEKNQGGGDRHDQQTKPPTGASKLFGRFFGHPLPSALVVIPVRRSWKYHRQEWLPRG